MKKFITYFLTIAMLISVISIATPTVYAANTLVAQFDTEDDLANWWYRYTGNVNVGTGLKADGTQYGSQTPNYQFVESFTSGGQEIYPTMGSKFLGITDLRYGGGYDATSTLRYKDDNGVPADDAAYLNIKLYSEVGGSIVLRWSVEAKSASTGARTLYYGNNGSKLTLKGGWEVISLPIPAANANDLITGFSYMSGGGYGLNSNTDAFKNTTLWIDGIYLSDTKPWTPQITGASIKEGNQLVSNDIGKITLKGTDIDIPADGVITMDPYVDLSFEKDGDNLDITFGDLDYATNYTLSFSNGVYDIFGNEFLPYTLNFRVRGENENIPPAVALTSPKADERYLPTDSITLTANATDENGTVEYVEFYLDDELIEGSRVTSETDEYTFLWNDAPESTDMRRITAKAVDNDGAEVVSEAVKIKILSYKNPTVSISSPADKAVFYNSVGGANGTSSFTLEAKTEDIDSIVEKLEIYLDGDLIHTATKDLTEFKYKYPDNLENGTHEIEVVVTDDMNLTGSASVSVDVISVGKSFPAVLENDLTISKWAVTKDTAKVESTDTGIVISTTANDAVRLERTLKRNMTISPWQADITVIPKDSSHSITLGLANSKTDISLITFKNDGTTSLDTIYEAGKTYVISAVADPENGKITTFINGEAIKENTLDASVFSSQVKLFVMHNGAKASTVVKSAEVYMLKEACEFGSIALYKDGAEQSLDSVSRTADYITVALDGGTDTDTLKGNVKLIDKASGAEAATEVRDGKIYINEILKSGKTYSVVVGSGVSNAEGRGLAGSHSADFIVEKASIDIKMSDNGSEIIVVCQNSTDTIINEAVVVICAYDGSRMVSNASINPVEFGIGKTEVTLPIPAADSGNTIEAFVVDSIDKLNPISDDIYIIRKEG